MSIAMQWEGALSGQPQDIMEELRIIGGLADQDVDLAQTAMLLGALDVPGSDLGTYRRHLGDLARDVGEAAADTDDVQVQAEILAQVIGETYGYDGDQLTFDDPYNANLLSVIDRRRGLPVTLGILYLHAGKAQGWAIDGINFPGHFLIAVGTGPETVVIDPFHSGRILSEAEIQGYLQRVRGPRATDDIASLGMMSARAILIRLLNNIKQRAVKAEDQTRALEIAERLVTIAPQQHAVLYDYAVLHAQAGHLSLALKALSDAASHAPDDGFRTKALTTLDSVKRRLN